MKKFFLLLIAFSFLITTPVFAFSDTGTQFAVSFCLKNNTNDEPIYPYWTYDTEDYSYGFTVGYLQDADIHAGLTYYNDETAQTGQIYSIGNITDLSTFKPFVVNYESQTIYVYYDGALIDSESVDLDNFPLEYGFGWEAENISNVNEYATTLTPTQISNLSCTESQPAETLSATSTLAQLGEVVIDTTLQFSAKVLADYFPYALIMLILSLMAGALIGFLLRPLNNFKK